MHHFLSECDDFYQRVLRHSCGLLDSISIFIHLFCFTPQLCVRVENYNCSTIFLKSRKSALITMAVLFSELL